MSTASASLPKVLRALRARRGMSQESLASAAGVHRTFVSMIERGQRNPTLEVVERLAMALGVRASLLISLCEEEMETSRGDGDGG